jgi:hypothetical protein
MARINSALFEKLQKKTGLSRSRVYALIDAKVRSAHLPRELAAIAAAAGQGINISRYASAEDLAAMRTAAISTVPAPVVVPAAPTKRVAARSDRRSTGRRRGTTVFVVHGRDIAARDAVFAFLRSLALKPLEWTQALKLTIRRRGARCGVPGSRGYRRLNYA